MKILELNLKAGEPQQIGRGRYVRLLQASGKVEIVTQTLGDKANQNGELIENVGAEFFKFETAQLLSDTDQKIKIAVSELMIFDNRMGVNSDSAILVKSVTANSYNIRTVEVNDTIPMPILASDSNRIYAEIYSDYKLLLANMNIQSQDDVIEIDKGKYVFKSTSQLKAGLSSAITSRAKIKIIEYLRD